MEGLGMCDTRIKNGSVIQIVGPSGSGKTFFICNLLSDSPNLFKLPIREIYWHSGVSEGEIGDTLTKLRKLKRVHHVHGLPEGWTDKPKKLDLIIIDDLFEEVNQDAVSCNQLFTKIARHRQVTVIFITQNLFHQGGKHRTRNLNTHYLVIFLNPRDKTVIDYLARQAYPTDRKFLIDAFSDATDNKPYGYLFMDFTQECPDRLRIRTNIFNKISGPIFYKQAK
jgi:energy-coupling factor transporter ATP-binding protein EcfA2